MELLLTPIVQVYDKNLRADRLTALGDINDNIIQHLRHAKAIVADATSQNPNVFYELGIAYALGRPVVLIIDDPKRIPFDTQTLAHIIIASDGQPPSRG